MFGENNKKAIAELNCYTYCMEESRNCFKKNDFVGAAIYLENAARSLKELEKLKEENNGQVRLVGYILGSRNNANDGV